MRRMGIYIDKLTESVVEVGTGLRWETDVVKMSADEWRGVLRKEGWLFNWRRELRAIGSGGV
jgi:hypothetical protein